MTVRVNSSSLGSSGRGELHVLLGAAPGVGKTYAMLREAHRLVDEGRDLVVGYVETHGRAETEHQIGDLEVIPRATWRYRNVEIQELDVDAVIARHPEIVLVDELAHTNGPGSAREKRYQDVEEIRQAGIDVLTTLNIQHLEGVHDVIASITGVEVRETIPDTVIAEATDIQLVDLPVEVLLERFEQGKIYPQERAQQALSNFFREGSLTALRELALRQTAAGIDERLNRFMMLDQETLADPAGERVVVLMDPSPAWGSVLRNGWRVASAMRGELVVAVLAPSGKVDLLGEQAAAVRANCELAEDLGAQVMVIADDTEELLEERGRVVTELLRRERATILVAGVKPQRRRRLLRSERETIDAALPLDVICRTGGVDAYLVVMRERQSPGTPGDIPG
jgi:two-component system sensor histidine kinase KdpD